MTRNSQQPIRDRVASTLWKLVGLFVFFSLLVVFDWQIGALGSRQWMIVRWLEFGALVTGSFSAMALGVRRDQLALCLLWMSLCLCCMTLALVASGKNVTSRSRERLEDARIRAVELCSHGDHRCAASQAEVDARTLEYRAAIVRARQPVPRPVTDATIAIWGAVAAVLLSIRHGVVDYVQRRKESNLSVP